MPLYEFQCQKCRASFEELVRGDEKPQCPQCASKRVEKQLSVTASPAISQSTGSKSLPMMNCGTPRCCGGGCQLPD